ncbi:MAG: 1-(5-phosphoribosyl)-5-[(5-phosphoribosylamino)methylideneamino]imidazole-4-carboxamide isomerase [Rhodospirillaceae bacterium]|jgi:phosphoribosylformimino-5-aminoimidazole carboxamide ribotide isomerase|nr:1-(5-phosphoribosyl)-5-[(5-phosphoribosylamino)methylideneamino]imidazole-4-carboxamide isomerase [Rhodospirillaceae bacterium]MBT6136850.1 1-(5-phosphoribosyl)-5-[(5-phosphoribosylamino)methylideneamino]imidazole-4-carboxamide isomerase [Rhodospirillaceae bacterium]
MILFPAIDLKDGQCVRLLRGEIGSATVYNDDPAAQARQFVGAGCEWIHVVDLDGAFAGHSVNGEAARAVLSAVAVPVQLGGGVRDMHGVESWLEAGVTRVILGTAAVRDPDFVKAACRNFPDRIVVGIDAKSGKVAVEGWAETSELGAIELAQRFEDSGVAAIVFTDIDRDGLLQGANVEATAALAEAISIPVIASGGVSSLDDLRALKARRDSGIAGVISGTALYDGRMDLMDALAVLMGIDD